MKTLKIVVGVLISFVMVNGAQAETTYKAFSTVKTDLQTMDWNGGKVTIGTLKGVTVISNSSDPIFNGDSIQSCLIRVIRIKDSSDVFAHCTLTDKDGDISFITAERKQGDASAGSGGRGKSTLLGGTGKWQGKTGSCDYTAKYLKDNWQTSEFSCVIK
ncbi:MAG: hypothetical protein ACKOA0_15210 [Burkholderiaceae bacterium]